MNKIEVSSESPGGFDFEATIDLFDNSNSASSPDSSNSPNNNKSIYDGVLKTNLLVPMNQAEKKRKLLLIVLVDKSRSIQTAWFQIQSTLLNLFTIISNTDQEVIAEILFFNNICFRLAYTPDNYRDLILAEKPNGKTCFAAAFDSVSDVIRQYYGKIKVGECDTDTAIVLLTDGSHTTVRDHKNAFHNLRNLAEDTISKHKCQINAHTMGFTANSRFNDLDGIRKLIGTKRGIYQYCESSEGTLALKEKLTFILKHALSNSTSNAMDYFLDITMKTKDSLGEASINVLFNDKDSVGVNNKSQKLLPDANGYCESSVAITSNVYQKDLQVLLQVKLKCGEKELVKLIEVQPSLKTVGKETIYYSGLMRLTNQTNIMFDTIKKVSESKNPSDMLKEDLLKEILTIQRELSNYDNLQIMKFSPKVRSEVVELKKNCQELATQLLDIINSWNRSSWTSTTSARVADITYQYMFKNTGRQRRINLKVARNSNSINKDSANFKQLEVDIDKLEDDLTEEQTKSLESSKQLFSCVLSMCDWVEVLEDKDCMGFGLSVQRPEVVIDDPTQLRIVEVSSTFLAKSSIEDAIALAVEVHGQEKTTGGFEVGQNKTSVAVRGRGREPINSWLPLYLNKEHWKPIKYQLKNIIAYFVTLDPMAFSFDQINALFLVCGTLISKDDIGERQLQLIIQFIRTLREVALHFNFIPKMLQQLNAILNSSIYLVSEQPKNLYVLISYLLVLSNQELESLFKTEQDWFRFWQHVLESALRRGCYAFFANMEQNKIDSYLSQVIFGKVLTEQEYNIQYPDQDTLDQKVITNGDEQQEKQVLNDSQLFDLVLTYKSTLINAPLVDGTIDYGSLLNIKQMHKTPNDKTRENHTVLNKDHIDTINTISNLFESKGYPNSNTLLNCMKFVKAFRSLDKDQDVLTTFNVIDDKYGVPPIEFIDSIKQGLNVASNNSGLGVYLNTVNQLYCSSAPKGATELLNIIRAMIVQGASYRINKHASHAVNSGIFTDTAADPIQCINVILDNVNHRLEEYLTKVRVALMFSAQTSNALKSGSVYEFTHSIPHVGHLHFISFVKSMMSFEKIPFGEEKMVVFLSNVYITQDDQGQLSAIQIKNMQWKYSKRYRAMFVHRFLESTVKYLEQRVLNYQYIYENQQSQKLTLLDDDDN
ncbi:hypothetical protein CYY_005180 [Polysphondylium violaceum]|uniref:VWFA domain-containing protein n=1 Tax=Polysphondylium violaceum TaxID=133409 RepID=A0A8J4PVH4_9MYCE|nr:hypothetical protein CYY_005180 [Polysphondylium violaceum]